MKEIEDIDLNVFLKMTNAILQKKALATPQDGNLTTLADMMSYGWPEEETQVLPYVHDY